MIYYAKTITIIDFWYYINIMAYLLYGFKCNYYAYKIKLWNYKLYNHWCALNK